MALVEPGVAQTGRGGTPGADQRVEKLTYFVLTVQTRVVCKLERWLLEAVT